MAPAVLDQIGDTGDGTLVIAADDNVFVGCRRSAHRRRRRHRSPSARQTRSLPLTARGEDGARHAYADPRLQREVGVRCTLSRLGLTGNPALAAVAGVPLTQIASDFDTSQAVGDPIASAAAVIRLLANAIDKGTQGLLLAVEQSSISAADLVVGSTTPRITRDEFPPRELPKFRVGTASASASRCPHTRALSSRRSAGKQRFSRRARASTPPRNSAAVACQQRRAAGHRVPARVAATYRHRVHPQHSAECVPTCPARTHWPSFSSTTARCGCC